MNDARQEFIEYQLIEYELLNTTMQALDYYIMGFRRDDKRLDDAVNKYLELQQKRIKAREAWIDAMNTFAHRNDPL